MKQCNTCKKDFEDYYIREDGMCSDCYLEKRQNETFEKILNGSVDDEKLPDKTTLNPNQIEKEKEILKEKARIAFESSDAVKKIKEKEALALTKKQEQEQERIDNEESVWFYSKDVKTREGPISFNELKNLLKSKTIDDDTLVWSPKLEDWEEAYKVINKKIKTKPTLSPSIKEHNLYSPEIVDYQSSSNSKNSTGGTIMKYLLGVIVVLAIFIITAVVFQPYSVFISSTLNTMGDISESKYVAMGTLLKLIPWILCIWLTGLSWKKITTEKD